ncbi:MAG TPA: hypothetical protein VGQ53_06905 [Chitinophagaceae bacterium]|nr:hypothetical protein [Chitinophagaceae bacterium]
MKSQRAYQILVVFLLIFPLRILSQQQMPLFAQKIPHILKAPGNFNGKEISADKTNLSCLAINNTTLQPLTLIPFPLRTAVVDPSFATQNLPFFCKKEFLFEKSTSVPLRIRLGSLEYVNNLEGKENHWSVVPGN